MPLHSPLSPLWIDFPVAWICCLTSVILIGLLYLNSFEPVDFFLHDLVLYKGIRGKKKVVFCVLGGTCCNGGVTRVTNDKFRLCKSRKPPNLQLLMISLNIG